MRRGRNSRLHERRFRLKGASGTHRSLLRGKTGRGRSSAGRALQWHCRGQGFDPPRLHHRPKKARGDAGFFVSGLARRGLPPIRRALPRARRDLVERHRIVHPPAEHHAVDLVAVADVAASGRRRARRGRRACRLRASRCRAPCRATAPRRSSPPAAPRPGSSRRARTTTIPSAGRCPPAGRARRSPPECRAPRPCAPRGRFIVDEIVLGRLDPPRAVGEQLRPAGCAP